MNRSFQCQHLGDVKLKAAFMYYRLQKANMKTQIQYFLHPFIIYHLLLSFSPVYQRTFDVENCVGEERKKENINLMKKTGRTGRSGLLF